MTLIRFRTNAALVAAGFVLLGSLAAPALADDHHHPTPDPGFSSATDPGFHHDDDSGEVAKREEQLQARYGHDRDIATPPLIVKQSFSSGKFVTKAIHVKHSAADAVPSDALRPTLSARSISVAKGKTVVQSLQPSDFESPASQFMKFAYITMGLLVVVLVALAIGVTSRKDRLNR